jgi:hypothetical protein
MKRVFTTFPFRVLIGAGDLGSKKRMLGLTFKEYNMTFKKFTLSNGKYFELAEVEISNKKLTIILTTFFNHRKNCLQLGGLKELFETAIKPSIMENYPPGGGLAHFIKSKVRSEKNGE